MGSLAAPKGTGLNGAEFFVQNHVDWMLKGLKEMLVVASQAKLIRKHYSSFETKELEFNLSE
jgi:hypothetical protein